MDSGATINSIPFEFVMQKNVRSKIRTTYTILTVFNNQVMKPKVEIYLDVRNPIDNKVICLRFLVVDNNVLNQF